MDCFCLEFEVVQMEDGKIKNKENDNDCNETIDEIIYYDEAQPQAIIPEEYSENNEDISTLPESETICHKILFDIIEEGLFSDIMEKIEKRLPSPNNDGIQTPMKEEKILQGEL